MDAARWYVGSVKVLMAVRRIGGGGGGAEVLAPQMVVGAVVVGSWLYRDLLSNCGNVVRHGMGHKEMVALVKWGIISTGSGNSRNRWRVIPSFGDSGGPWRGRR